MRQGDVILQENGVSVIEETLSDGSKVYNAWLGDCREVPCRSRDVAEAFYSDVIRAIHRAEEG